MNWNRYSFSLWWQTALSAPMRGPFDLTRRISILCKVKRSNIPFRWLNAVYFEDSFWAEEQLFILWKDETFDSNFGQFLVEWSYSKKKFPFKFCMWNLKFSTENSHQLNVNFKFFEWEAPTYAKWFLRKLVGSLRPFQCPFAKWQAGSVGRR